MKTRLSDSMTVKFFRLQAIYIHVIDFIERAINVFQKVMNVPIWSRKSEGKEGGHVEEILRVDSADDPLAADSSTTNSGPLLSGVGILGSTHFKQLIGAFCLNMRRRFAPFQKQVEIAILITVSCA